MENRVHNAANYFLEPEYITEAPKAPTGSFVEPAQTTNQFGGRERMTPKDIRHGTDSDVQSFMAHTLSVDGLHAIEGMDFPFSRKMMNTIVDTIQKAAEEELDFSLIPTDLDKDPDRIAKTFEINGHRVQLDEYALSTAKNADKADALTKLTKDVEYTNAMRLSSTKDGIMLKVYVSEVPTSEIGAPEGSFTVTQRKGFNFGFGFVIPAKNRSALNSFVAEIIDICSTEQAAAKTIGGRETSPALLRATTSQFPDILDFITDWTLALKGGDVALARAKVAECHSYIKNNLKIPKTRLTGGGLSGSKTWQNRLEKDPTNPDLIVAVDLLRASLVSSYNKTCNKLGLTEAMLTEAGIVPAIKTAVAGVGKFIMSIWLTLRQTFSPLDDIAIEGSDLSVADAFEQTAKAELKLLTNPAKAKQDMEALLAQL